VGRFDSAGYPLDLIPSVVDAPGLVEQGVLGEDVFDDRPAALGIVLPERRGGCVSAAWGCCATWLVFPICTRWQSYEARRSLNPRQ
jgi:hypothetical protein